MENNQNQQSRERVVSSYSDVVEIVLEECKEARDNDTLLLFHTWLLCNIIENADNDGLDEEGMQKSLQFSGAFKAIIDHAIEKKYPSPKEIEEIKQKLQAEMPELKSEEDRQPMKGN